MRSIIISMLLIVSVASLSAQVEQGMISFNGAFHATQQWEGSGEAEYNPLQEGFTLLADPSFSYMLANRFMLGAGFNTALYSMGRFNEYMIFFEPQVRFYFNPAGRSAFYAELVSRWNLDYFDDSRLQFGLGLDQFIRDNIALETSLNYSVNEDYDVLSYRLGVRPFVRPNPGEKAPVLQNGTLLLGSRQISIDYYDMENLFFEFTPQGGYFFTDRALIGVDGWASFASQSEGFSLRLHPYLRAYLPVKGPWLWFSSAGLVWEHESFGAQDWHTNNWTVTADVGTDLFLRPDLAIEFRLIGGLFVGGTFSRNFIDNQIVDKADLGGIRLGTDVAVKYFIGPKQQK